MGWGRDAGLRGRTKREVPWIVCLRCHGMHGRLRLARCRKLAGTRWDRVRGQVGVVPCPWYRQQASPPETAADRVFPCRGWCWLKARLACRVQAGKIAAHNTACTMHDCCCPMSCLASCIGPPDRLRTAEARSPEARHVGADVLLRAACTAVKAGAACTQTKCLLQTTSQRSTLATPSASIRHRRAVPHKLQ